MDTVTLSNIPPSEHQGHCRSSVLEFPGILQIYKLVFLRSKLQCFIIFCNVNSDSHNLIIVYFAEAAIHI